MKRIIICSDGTWNRPEQFGEEDYPTNVLKFARGIRPTDANGVSQIVFYDWGIGSYHDKFTGGGFGQGLEKNIMDAYRFLVHNYEPGDEIYLFGFSRGAYTVRSLSGLINNCSILKSIHGNRIEEAFELYKNKDNKPQSPYSVSWRQKYAIEDKANIHFIGVWDTVGAMGLPFSIFSEIDDRHLFYDCQLGSNIITARHALSLDEQRDDFKPTIWEPKPGVDLEQVWFAGIHCDVGGGYKPDADGTALANIPMRWLQEEAEKCGLEFEPALKPIKTNPFASQHNEYKRKYLLLGKHVREIPDQQRTPTWVHKSVRERYDGQYTSKPIESYVNKHGKWPPIWDK